MASRFSMEDVQRIFEIEAPRIFPDLRLDRYATKPDEYKYADTRRLWQLWWNSWDICQINIPPNIESLTHDELKAEAFRRFARVDNNYEVLFLVRVNPPAGV